MVRWIWSRSMPNRLLAVRLGLGLALVMPIAGSAAQPGFPPNDPDSWRVAGTAKILCSALFVSGRDSAEARAHVTPYFLGVMVDSITNVEVDRKRKLVRLTVAPRLSRAFRPRDDADQPLTPLKGVIE